jgi:choice-of-anchor C domain-containing protein
MEAGVYFVVMPAPQPRNRVVPTTLALALILAGAAGPAMAANLAKNGSFEVGPEPNMSMPMPMGSTAIQDWTVVVAAVDYVGGSWAAAQGARSLALNGTTPGGIAQSIATLAGQPYTVKFMLAGDAFTEPLFKHVRVSAAGQQQDFEFDASHAWPWDMGWSERTFAFTSNSTTTTLQFTSLTAGDAGPVIDSVVVTGPSPVGVDDRGARGFALSSPIPNPSPEGATVTFIVPVAASLRLTVHDARGREVRVLTAGPHEAGAYARAWDGRTATGARAAPGLYFIRLTAPGAVELVRKAILVP